MILELEQSESDHRTRVVTEQKQRTFGPDWDGLTTFLLGENAGLDWVSDGPLTPPGRADVWLRAVIVQLYANEIGSAPNGSDAGP